MFVSKFETVAGCVPAEKANDEETFVRGGDRRNGSLAHMEDSEQRGESVPEQEVYSRHDVARVRIVIAKTPYQVGVSRCYRNESGAETWLSGTKNAVRPRR